MKHFLAAAVALVPLLPRPAVACSEPDDASWTLRAIPADDSVPFPHDADPLVILGLGWQDHVLPDDSALEVRPALFDAAGAEIDVDLIASVRSDFGFPADWIRVHPVEPLPADERFTLRLMADNGTDEDQERFDRDFGVREFLTGRSLIEEEPAPIEFDVRVLDHPATPPYPNPCGPSGSGAYTKVDVLTDATPAQPHDIWRFFEVDEGAEIDPDDDHTRYVDSAVSAIDAEVLERWTTDSEADVRCVIMVTEDAYGRSSAPSEPVCAEAAPACSADCSAAGERSSAAAATLALLLGLVGRRRRADLG